MGLGALLVGSVALSCSSASGDDDDHGAAGEAGAGNGGRKDTDARGGRGQGAVTEPGAGGLMSVGGERAGAGNADVGGANAGGTDAGSTDTSGDTSGADAGGASGVAGAAGSGQAGEDVTAVHGRVIDFFGHGVPGVITEIGGNLATTNGDGRFTFAHVDATYDVTLLVQRSFGPGSPTTLTFGWAYQGVTRRDPTLQVVGGSRNASLQVHPLGFDFGYLAVQWGAPLFGNFYRDLQPGPGEPTSFPINAFWASSGAESATIYGVGWTGLGDGLRFGSTQVALPGSLPANLSVDLDMKLAETTPVMLSGVVTTAPRIPAQEGSDLDTSSFVYAQMPEGGAVQMDDTYLNGTFDLASTLIAGTTLSLVTVTANNNRSSPLAVVHEDGIVASTSGLDFTMPQPATLVSPKYPVTIDPYTEEFSYTLGTGVGEAVVFALNDRSSDAMDGAGLDWLYVVTTKRHFTLPKIVDGRLSLRHGSLCTWTVQTHGVPTDVDAMVGPAGFVDPYSSHGAEFPYVSSPLPARSGRGSFTVSTHESFTVAP